MKIQKLMQQRWAQWVGYWLWLSMVAAVPVLSAWQLNSYQVTLVDLVVPLVLSVLTGLVVAIVFVQLLRQDRLAANVAGLFAVLVLSTSYETRLQAVYNVIKALNPIPELNSWEGVVFSLIFIAGVFLIAHFLGKKVSAVWQQKKWEKIDLAGGIPVVVLVIFFLQIYSVGKIVIGEWPQFFYRPAPLSLSAKAGDTKPDVYYIVLDRYTSQDVLRAQFNFDNSPFTNFLADQGFSVNPDAHQNYPYTTMSISSTLDAQYHSDEVKQFSGASYQTVEPYHDDIRYAPVIQEFKSLGYSFTQLGTWYEASNQAPLADHSYQPDGLLTIFNHTVTLNTFSKEQITTSIFWRFLQQTFSLGNFTVYGYSGIPEQDATTAKIQILKDLATAPAGGRFIFAHLLIPHDPYYFNADGSTNPNSSSDNVGEPIKQKYVNQVQFINGQMEQIVTDINTATQGKAVIIIQSDEGPYPIQLNGENFDGDAVTSDLASGSMLDWSNTDLTMKYGILAAYHVPQASVSDMQQGNDSVNIFRVVLNAYFNAGLPYLPRCYYAYPNGRNQPFVYTDITQRITGSANPACPADSIFKP